MKVINLLGSAGSGKSTTALGLTYELKKRGHRAEYIPEYAKDLVFSKCEHLLVQNQLFVFADSKNCCIFEKQLHNKYKQFRYKPLKHFNGSNECFDYNSLIEEVSLIDDKSN